MDNKREYLEDLAFGAYDSEMQGWSYTIPEGFTAEIKDGQVIIKRVESEDERIRNKIAKCLACGVSKGVIDHNENEKLLAWLEKQKNLEGDFARGYDSGYEACLHSHGAEWFEKQKEQKPMLFVPKFHVGDKVISTKNKHLTYEILGVGHINELGNPEYQVEIFDDGKRGVNGKFPNESPNIKYIECQKMDEWGKLLSEQKPAEWSEEDERAYRIVLNEYQQMYEHRATSLSRDDIVAVYNFLTNLRLKQGQIIYADADRIHEYLPRIAWKPSEEQMTALKYFIDFHQPAYLGSTMRWKEYEWLQSLHDDLLKLQ